MKSGPILKRTISPKLSQLINTIDSISNLYCVVTCRRDGAPFIFEDLLNFPSCYEIDVTGHIINSTEQLDSDILLQQSQLPLSYGLENRTLSVVPHYQKKIKRVFQTRGRKRKTAGERRKPNVNGRTPPKHSNLIRVLLESLAPDRFLSQTAIFHPRVTNLQHE